MKQMTTLFAFVSILLVGCLSLPTGTRQPIEIGTPQERKESTLRRLNRLIEEEEYQQIIQRIDYHRRDATLFAPDELAQLYSQAVSGVGDFFESAVAEQRFDDALRYYQSMVTLGMSDRFPDWSLDRLYLGLSKQYLQSGNNVAALHSFLRVSDIETVEAETFSRFIDLAVEDGNRYFLQRMAALATDERVDSGMSISPTPEEMLTGTATVWVDRGIKIERGVGRPDRSIGSSFFIDRRGYLITNYHVIVSEVDPEYEGYSRLFIRLPSDPTRRIPAKVVGYDRIFDIALLKTEIDPPFVFSFSGVRELQVGSRIIALGSPGGLGNTITAGIISATKRRFFQLGDALQVDVPINPGNSGGPVVDEQGELVGVVFAGIEQFEGVNFAIPSYWLEKFLPRLYSEREVKHAWLGVAIRKHDAGLEVLYVTPGSPAAASGLLKGDIIRSIQGWKPTDIAEAQDILLSIDPDSLIEVEWERDAVAMRGIVHLLPRPFSPIEEVLEFEPPESLFAPLFGMEADTIGSRPWRRDFLVTRVYPGTIADETGLSIQDPISLFDWNVDLEQRVIFIRIAIRKRRAGYLPNNIILATPIELDTFI